MTKLEFQITSYDVSKLQELAELRFSHAAFRKNLRERIEGQLTVAHQNGLFKATPTLIAFLHCFTEDELCIEDFYNNPIKCNRTVLLDQLKEAYQFAMDAWYSEFESSKTIRKITRV